MIEAFLGSIRRIAAKEGLIRQFYATRNKEGLSHVAILIRSGSTSENHTNYKVVPT
jgi:hypothetical protein